MGNFMQGSVFVEYGVYDGIRPSSVAIGVFRSESGNGRAVLSVCRSESGTAAVLI